MGPPIDIEKTVRVSEGPYTATQDEATDKRGVMGYLRFYETWLDKRLGVEVHGPDRVRPEDKKPPSILNAMFIWFSGCMNISCFATGSLGWQFGLALRQTIPITIFASILGGAVTGWCATLGPGTGCRQVAISRYSLGWYPSKIIAFLNVIEQIGWCTTACVTGGLCLTAVCDGKISLALGVFIIAVVALTISFIGLRAVLLYDKYSWIPTFIVFIILYGEAGKFADTHTPAQVSGATFSGACLSLFSVVYGSSASWSSIVSDYYVHYPTDTPKWKICSLVTIGISFPTCIGMVIGCIVASALNNNTEWTNIYDDEGVGYLLQAVLYPRGFAKFLLVLLVLASIGMTTIAIYSAGLSAQLFAQPFKRVPRFIWCLVMFVVVLALAIAGREHLSEILENFLSLLGYWNTAFFVILFTEHYYFRDGSLDNYDLESWNTQSKLPIGIAGLVAFLLGIVGCILGMSQTWYIGCLSGKIGESGGDVGNELALIFTAVSYPPLRYWELKRFGR
ncbi:MAG: hypothetical protein M1834_000239 [Cirrosporium novae-zelandiae]|nr:MAG: hypothetical protein M1834_000239 [Cirrosporium novae-zelandiae]